MNRSDSSSQSSKSRSPSKKTRGLELWAKGKKIASGVGRKAVEIAVRSVEAEAWVKSVMIWIINRPGVAGAVLQKAL